MKKAIIIASFGCSLKGSREKYIETIENRVKEEFHDIDCFRVFTSEIIRRKIKREENIEIDNMQLCLEKLKNNGYTHVYVLATHIIPGFEYEKITRMSQEYEKFFEKMKISRPFLDDSMSSEEVHVIKTYIGSNVYKDEAVVLVGHGSDHSSHKYYEQFESLCREEIEDLYIINVEGGTFAEDIIGQLKNKQYKKIHLYPFMVVAGDHAINDIASEDEESIKTSISSNGFEVDAFVTGLGSNREMCNIFVKRIQDILVV